MAKIFKDLKEKRSFALPLLATGAIVLVAAAIVGATYYFAQRPGDDTQQTEEVERPLTAYEKASQALEAEGYDEAQALIGEAYESASSDEERITILNNRAALSMNAQKFEDALKYAEQSYELKENVPAAQTAAAAAEQADKREVALDYNKKLLALMDTPQTGYLPEDIEDVKRKIAELEA